VGSDRVSDIRVIEAERTLELINGVPRHDIGRSESTFEACSRARTLSHCLR